MNVNLGHGQLIFKGVKNTYRRKDSLSNKRGPEKLDNHMQSKPLTSYKINSKWIKDWNVRPEATRKKALGNSSGQQNSKHFFVPDWENTGYKSKNRHIELRGTEEFSTAKEILNRVNRPTEWHKIPRDSTSDNGINI